MPLLRKITRLGGGWAVLLPADIRNKPEWVGATHVQMDWDPPRVILTPRRFETEAMQHRAALEGGPIGEVPDR